MLLLPWHANKKIRITKFIFSKASQPIQLQPNNSLLFHHCEIFSIKLSFFAISLVSLLLKKQFEKTIGNNVKQDVSQQPLTLKLLAAIFLSLVFI